VVSSANLPAPYAGVDENLPKAALRSPFCENLFNFNTNEAGISLRNGDSKYYTITPAYTPAPRKLAAYGNTALFAVDYKSSTTEMLIYNVETGATAYTSAASGNDSFYSFYFNNYLYLFGQTVYYPGFQYDGATWTTITYTGSGLRPISGAVYNNRAYLAQYGEAAYWYSEISAVTGALTKINLAPILLEKSELYIITPITIADTVSSVNLLAFVFNSGEVLFYSGSYPDSDSWGLVGRGKIGPPVNYDSYVAYQGDALIFCDTGVVSLRDLFLKGSEAAASLTVNSRIQRTWTDLIQAMRVSFGNPSVAINPHIRGVWDPKTNRIIISFPSYIDSSRTFQQSGSFYFVFDTLRKSWNFQRSYGNGSGRILDILRYKNKILTLCEGSTKIMVYEKEGSTGFTDRSANDDADTPYQYTMLSAPIPLPKTAVYEAVQIEPILESDLYAETNWSFVVDFGRQSSGNQKTDAATTAVAKPAVNVGMQNITYVQVQMSGTTAAAKTVGLDLYSYNVWYNSGEIASR